MTVHTRIGGLRPPLTRLHFFVPGTPIPQGSKQPVTMRESSPGLVAWRHDVIVMARQARAGRWPCVVPPGVVRVQALFRFNRPKSGLWKDAVHPGRPPDLDKLQRAVGDALTMAGVVVDDAQIVEWFTWKRWVEPGGLAPGVGVMVERLEVTG